MIEEKELNGTYWFHGDKCKCNGWTLDELNQLEHMITRILREKGLR